LTRKKVRDVKRNNYKILPSKLFLKDKYEPDGSFDKFKARLVAGGHRQGRADYDTISSTTVSTAAMFTVAAISAKEGRARMTTDVPATYINAKMKKDMPNV
jgi:hypothetical protein